MKKFIISIVALLSCSTAVFAEETDNGYFDHLSIGLNVGTPGIGIDLAAPIGNYVQMRVGYSIMPNIKFNTDIDVSNYISQQVRDAYGKQYNIPNNVAVQAKTNIGNAKILFDIYPFRSNAFFVTAGAYIGVSKVAKVYNKVDGVLKGINDANADIDKFNKEYAGKPGFTHQDNVGVKVGDDLLTPDANGNMDGDISVNGFKPYLGLGYGRSVPNKSVGFQVELGCMFWGTPKVYCQDKQITKDNVTGDASKVVKNISNLTVYPTLNFRLCFKAF